MTARDWLYLGTFVSLFIGTWAYFFDQAWAGTVLNLGACLFFTRDAIERFSRLRDLRSVDRLFR